MAGRRDHRGGSSGCPLLLSDSRLIVGQLWGGNASCSYPDEPDYFGRFEETFPLVDQWLGEGEGEGEEGEGEGEGEEPPPGVSQAVRIKPSCFGRSAASIPFFFGRPWILLRTALRVVYSIDNRVRSGDGTLGQLMFRGALRTFLSAALACLAFCSVSFADECGACGGSLRPARPGGSPKPARS